MRSLVLVFALFASVPALAQDCYQNFCVGKRVIFLNDNSYATIVSRQGSSFTLRWDNGNVGPGWGVDVLARAYGSHDHLSVGTRVQNVEKLWYGTVAGVTNAKTFVVEWDGIGRGNGWTADQLGVVSGCFNDGTRCVGEKIIHSTNGQYAFVRAISTKGHALLEYVNGGWTHGWGEDVLAVISGCHQGLCINDRVYNSALQRVGVIAGMLPGSFVIRNECGGMDSGWGADVLYKIQ
jgi:hypothetical protein